MEQKIKNKIKNSLFEMSGKLTKKQFQNIVKKMNWKLDYQKIHIVGTNGKGSIAKYLSDNLENDKNRVGLFTSPHIINFEERIKINNKNIEYVDLQQHMIDIYLKFPKYLLGFFELMFLSCISYFETKKINIAIFEAGIGAKKDIVNFLNFHILILTSISIDHEKILGAKIEDIATDKSFAIKETNTIYYSNILNKESEKIINSRAQLMKNKNLIKIILISTNIHDQNKEFTQEILKKEFNLNAKLFSPPIGRAQKIIINKNICYLDVGHNEEGIRKTLLYFQEKNIYFDNYIVSLSNDKNIKKIMKNFDEKNTFIYQNKNKRALSNFDFPQHFGKVYSLKKFIKNINKRILFIGSFYFIEEILKEISYDKN